MFLDFSIRKYFSDTQERLNWKTVTTFLHSKKHFLFPFFYYFSPVLSLSFITIKNMFSGA